MSPKHWLIDRNAKVSNFKEWKGLLKISVTLPLLLLLLEQKSIKGWVIPKKGWGY